MDYKSFKDRIAKDKAFVKEFEGIEDIKKLIAEAEKKGFSFTEEDVRKENTLPESDLLSVAGGNGPSAIESLTFDKKPGIKVILDKRTIDTDYTPSIMGG